MPQYSSGHSVLAEMLEWMTSQSVFKSREFKIRPIWKHETPYRGIVILHYCGCVNVNNRIHKNVCMCSFLYLFRSGACVGFVNRIVYFYYYHYRFGAFSVFAYFFTTWTDATSQIECGSTPTRITCQWTSPKRSVYSRQCCFVWQSITFVSIRSRNRGFCGNVIPITGITWWRTLLTKWHLTKGMFSVLKTKQTLRQWYESIICLNFVCRFRWVLLIIEISSTCFYFIVLAFHVNLRIVVSQVQ